MFSNPALLQNVARMKPNHGSTMLCVEWQGILRGIPVSVLVFKMQQITRKWQHCPSLATWNWSRQSVHCDCTARAACRFFNNLSRKKILYQTLSNSYISTATWERSVQQSFRHWRSQGLVLWWFSSLPPSWHHLGHPPALSSWMFHRRWKRTTKSANHVGLWESQTMCVFSKTDTRVQCWEKIWSVFW